MKQNTWTLAITSTALKDYQDILSWTLASFGMEQTRIYGGALEAAFQALREGPDVAGAKTRPELGAGIASLHIARNGYKGRHFVIFRVAAKAGNVIEVLRVLHDSMDLQRRSLFTDAD